MKPTFDATRRVLLVINDPSLRAEATEALQEAGIAADIARDAEEATTFLLDRKARYALILIANDKDAPNTSRASLAPLQKTVCMMRSTL